MARLRETYNKEIVPVLQKELDLKNTMQVPKLTKIVVNIGMGEAITNVKVLENAMDDLARITGQRPRLNRARLSVAAFKLREGMPVGAKVTLRGQRMYEFFDRLVNVSLPRIRDFRGVPTKSFDGRGNYTLGLKEHTIFPEIDYDRADTTFGMDISFVTTARNDEQGFMLLKQMKMPFKNQNQ